MRKFMTWLALLMTGFSIFMSVTVGVSSFVGTNIVFAKDDDKKDDSSDESSEKSEEDKEKEEKEKEKEENNKKTNNDTNSAWAEAVSSMANKGSDIIMSPDDYKKDKDGDSNGKKTLPFEPSTSMTVGNAWSFLGSDNSVVWTYNTKSSVRASYQSFIDMANKPDDKEDKENRAYFQGDAREVVGRYKQSARFAYILSATRLDSTGNTGFTKIPFLQEVIAFFMRLSFAASRFVQATFAWSIKFLQDTNVISWALKGPVKNSPFADVAQWVHDVYGYVIEWGPFVIFVMFACSLAFGIMGIRVGSSMIHTGPSGIGQNISSTIWMLFKRTFVFIGLPMLLLSSYSMVLGNLNNFFDRNESSVPNYAVFSTFLNYSDWAYNSNLAIPSDVHIETTFDDTRLPILKSSDILSINKNAAGVSGLQALKSKNVKEALSVKETDVDNANLNDKAQALIQAWGSGENITASSYASYVSGKIMPNLIKKSDGSNDGTAKDYDTLAELLQTQQHAGNGTLNSSGNDNSSVFTSNGKGLSDLGMYVYLLTTADTTNTGGLKQTDATKLANEVSAPIHYSVVIPGASVQVYGNLMWAFGLMVGSSLLAIGYTWLMFRSIIDAMLSTLSGVMQTGFGMLRGGVQLASAVLGFIIGVLGTAILYQLMSQLFIAVAATIDNLLSTNGASAVAWLLDFGGDSTAVKLSSSVTNATLYGMYKFAFGLGLLYLVYKFVRVRTWILQIFVGGIEELMGKLLGTGDFTGQVAGKLGGTSPSGVGSAVMKTASFASRATQTLSRMGVGKMAMLGAAGYAGAKTAGALSNGKEGPTRENPLLGSASPDRTGVNAGDVVSDSDNDSQNLQNLAFENDNDQMNNSEHLSDNAQNLENMSYDHLSSNGQNLDQSDKSQNASDNLSENGQNVLGDQDLSQYVVSDDGTSLSDNGQNLAGDQNMENSLSDNGQNLDMSENALSDNGQSGIQSLSESMNNDSSLAGDSVSEQGDVLSQLSYGDNLAGDSLSNNGDMYSQNVNNLASDSLSTVGDTHSQSTNNLASDSLSNGDSVTNSGDNLVSNLDNAMNSGDTNLASSSLSDSVANTAISAGNAFNSSIDAQANGHIVSDTGISNNLSSDIANNDASNINASSALSENNAVSDNRALNSLHQNLSGGSFTSANDVRSSMTDVKTAYNSALSAKSLSDSMPSNDVLRNESADAMRTYNELSNNAVNTFNNQSAISLSDGLVNSGSSATIGQVNDSLKAIDGASKNYSQLVDRFGNDASNPYIQKASNDLLSARQSAINLGVNSDIINNDAKLSDTLVNLDTQIDSVRTGDWKPNTLVGNSLSNS